MNPRHELWKQKNCVKLVTMKLTGNTKLHSDWCPIYYGATNQFGIHVSTCTCCYPESHVDNCSSYEGMPCYCAGTFTFSRHTHSMGIDGSSMQVQFPRGDHNLRFPNTSKERKL